MKASLTAKQEFSQLVVIDMQQQLAAAMATEALQAVVKNTNILLQASSILDIPTILTEQYPKALGRTMSEINTPPNLKPIEKITFSCCNEPAFCRKLTADRPQIVLAGMEAHICILQTALQLSEIGHQVFVVEDAIISRSPLNKANALARLRQAGIIIGTTESVVFEWLGAAGTDAFKQISRLIK